MTDKSIKKGWQQFLQWEHAAQKNKQVDAFFDLLLTPEEYDTISKRALLIKALLEGSISQRDIAETYDVSISKITRGSNALKRIPMSLRKLLEKEII